MTEQQIAFQRGDFIRLDSKNDIVVVSIEHIFVHVVLELQDQQMILRTMGAPRFIVGLIDKVSKNLGTMGTGNARAGSFVDFTIIGVVFISYDTMKYL